MAFDWLSIDIGSTPALNSAFSQVPEIASQTQSTPKGESKRRPRRKLTDYSCPKCQHRMTKVYLHD
ncbi:MAG: hypothetical protein RID53_19750 [Coleofasciculus sp. B1-GNL1-01]|uniref:hypothetical protein n=1 Tax=Coleofasciculus sp. B1-GNL1-01 TaxID=3068484 RepID=UPI0032FC7A00